MFLELHHFPSSEKEKFETHNQEKNFYEVLSVRFIFFLFSFGVSTLAREGQAA